MKAKPDRNLLIDLFLVALAVIVLGIAGWTWIVVFPVAQEIVLVVVTIALTVSVLLFISSLLLVILRLRSRVARLEHYVTQSSVTVPLGGSPVEVVTLSNVERRILNRLEEGGGNLTQDQLRRASGLSKSTLSVALRNLERKSLITRQEYGRSKMVILAREIRR